MTNKEYFKEVLEGERSIFEKAIKALPDDKIDFKVHEKSRTAGSLASQLAAQWSFITGIVKKGAPEGGAATPEKQKVSEMTSTFIKNYDELIAALDQITDEEWETGKAVLEFPGGKWEAKKYDMAWGFLFDAIHHRGQLSTFLRAMGTQVPSIYGGSADERPGGN